MFASSKDDEPGVGDNLQCRACPGANSGRVRASGGGHGVARLASGEFSLMSTAQTGEVGRRGAETGVLWNGKAIGQGQDASSALRLVGAKEGW